MALQAHSLRTRCARRLLHSSLPNRGLTACATMPVMVVVQLSVNPEITDRGRVFVQCIGITNLWQDSNLQSLGPLKIWPNALWSPPSGHRFQLIVCQHYLLMRRSFWQSFKMIVQKLWSFYSWRIFGSVSFFLPQSLAPLVLWWLYYKYRTYDRVISTAHLLWGQMGQDWLAEQYL